jgi:RNA polymerase sigma-70 factor
LGVCHADLMRYGDELCLAMQCARLQRYSLEVLEAAYFSTAHGTMSRLGLSGDLLLDGMQELRIRLLMGSKPRIARYRAAGPLTGWICVAARRAALNLKLFWARRREVDLSEVTADLYSDPATRPPHPYSVVAHAALSHAVSKLTPRGAELLSLQLRGVNVEHIGQVHGVHRATAARHLAAVRREIRDDVARELQLQFRLSPREALALLVELAGELDPGALAALVLRGSDAPAAQALP